MKSIKGYILLTDTGTVLTKLIKLYTRKPYNHASIGFDAALSEVYSFGRKRANNPFHGGFVREDTRSGLFKEATCVIYSFNLTENQLVMMKQCIQKIESRKAKYRYNVIGLFGFLWNKPIKRKNAFFCSQFVASVLEEGGIIDFEKPLSLMTPNDLQEIHGLGLEFEGRLYDYHHDYSTIEEDGFPLPFLSSSPC